MRKIDFENWNRKEIFQHFKRFDDPYFSVLVSIEVTTAYLQAKEKEMPFFALLLHACLSAMVEVEPLRMRELDGEIVVFDTLHASATMMHADETIGFTFVRYDTNISIFVRNYLKEKERVAQGTNLFPPQNTLDCIYCSAMPWLSFSGHKEPHSGSWETVPKLAFSKREKKDNKYYMNVSIAANHALVDGLHIGRFIEKFQNQLNKEI
ncbi:MAG: CatA-like O-acetyltransferase [Flavobacteriaceae bacterium]|nr:CatA-like O-acetyltransferase [Flavobacteriaceae bacterium]